MKKFKINKEKLINFIIILIVILLYIAVFMYIFSSFRERKRKEVSKGIVEKIDDIISHNESIAEAEISYGAYKYTVLGKLYIKKINLNEPILKENTAGAYNTALVKITGPNLNENGNFVIGGHNFMRGNYFIKINRLVKNDVITLTDLSGRKENYYVYEYGIYNKDDASYLAKPSNNDEKIVTLVTCTKGGKERYVVKARAK